MSIPFEPVTVSTLRFNHTPDWDEFEDIKVSGFGEGNYFHSITDNLVGRVALINDEFLICQTEVLGKDNSIRKKLEKIIGHTGVLENSSHTHQAPVTGTGYWWSRLKKSAYTTAAELIHYGDFPTYDCVLTSKISTQNVGVNRRQPTLKSGGTPWTKLGLNFNGHNNSGEVVQIGFYTPHNKCILELASVGVHPTCQNMGSITGDLFGAHNIIQERHGTKCYMTMPGGIGNQSPIYHAQTKMKLGTSHQFLAHELANNLNELEVASVRYHRWDFAVLSRNIEIPGRPERNGGEPRHVYTRVFRLASDLYIVSWEYEVFSEILEQINLAHPEARIFYADKSGGPGDYLITDAAFEDGEIYGIGDEARETVHGPGAEDIVVREVVDMIDRLKALAK